MRRPPTILVGCIVLFAAIAGFLGTTYWVDSRTLRAVDMPVSLARGTVNLTFDLNIQAFYSINIGPFRVGDLVCGNGAGLRTRRISAVGELPVYRYQWVEDNSRSLGLGQDVIEGEFLGGFEGRRGHYHLRIEVLSDTACLNALNPRLYILSSNEDFLRWNRYGLNAFWISFVSGSLGLGILLVGLQDRLRNRSTEECNLSFFEPRPTESYAALQRQRAAPWIPFFSQIALLYSQILLLLVICGVLVFHCAWGYDHRSQGLFVLTYLPESQFFKHVPCTQAWVVRVESSDKWYLNSARIEPDDLPDTLRAQIGTRTSCTVFFDAEPDVPYADAIRAMDLIERSPGRVVLLTPQTKRVRIP
jgi:biopolymer transport protein ExbD